MLAKFLSDLINEQRIAVAAPQPVTEEDRRSAAAILDEMEQQIRNQAAGVAPDFCEQTALSAAETLLAACQMLVYREFDAHLPEIRLTGEQPRGRSASDHYSVDVVLRFLPDVFRLASAASKNDPLVRDLLELANQWPLSAVGISSADGWDCALEHPSLLMTFVDRAIERNDHSRLQTPAVASAVRAAIGEFPELAPKLAKAMETTA